MAYPLRDETPSRATTWGTWSLLAICLVVFAFLQPRAMQGLTHGFSVADHSRAELQIRAFEDRWAVIPCEITHNRSIAEGAACDGYPVDDPDAYVQKNVWVPLLTAMFLHVGISHLLGNLLFLWVFGRGLEERIGSLGVIALFLAGGIASFLGFVIVTPESMVPALGASGAIAALMGAYLVIEPRRRLLSFVYAAGVQVIYLPAWTLLGFFLVSQFFTAQGSQVAWQAHVAGMAFGMLVALILRWRIPSLRNLSRPPSDGPATPPEDRAVKDELAHQSLPLHPPTR